ncbi:CFAP20 [Cordylochernes scorpioides]|uniref:CFAP20 n=1 Tax=Cordylochernes scorpioides TaxID=51811 RepID=A0ABY6KGV8_9ARAC|nr:CFAP20 [Cordylochernes scorpioides]UYV68083.1 CFAP20 [Cordylochernes scorpioides]
MVRHGYIKRIQDNHIGASVLEIVGTNVASNFLICPADPKITLGIRMPYLAFTLKNLKKYFAFEVQIIDNKSVRRRFRASSFQTVTKVVPFLCTLHLRLEEGWNQVWFNLEDFTRRAYGSGYVETLRVQVHANCRLRRVFFADRQYAEEDLPIEFKLYPTSQA